MRAFALGAALLLGAPLAGAAQQGSDGGTTLVLPVRHSTAVAVARALPHGSSSDPEGLEGASWILAEALALDASRRLDHLPARVEASVERGRTVFTLVTVPGRWRTALSTLDDVLFRAPPTTAAAERARGDLLDQLGFEEGAPIREFQLEALRFYLGAAHPWARPIRGFRVTVERVTAEVLAALHQERYRMREAVTVVAGPVEPDGAGASPEAEGAVVGEVAGPDSLAPEPPDPAAADPAALPGPAWYGGEDMHIDRPITSTWIGIGFPVDPALPRTELEFLAHTLQDLLVTDPPDPGLFAARIHLDDTPRGAVLAVEVAAAPEEAPRWASFVVDAVETLSREIPTPSSFGMRRRRFRSDRFLARASVRGLAGDAARDLLRNGTARHLFNEVQALDVNALRRAASALGEPRVLIYGPTMGDRD